MNKLLRSGIIMQSVQMFFLLVIAVAYGLSLVSWSAGLIISIIFISTMVIFNIASFIMIVVGLIGGRK